MLICFKLFNNDKSFGNFDNVLSERLRFYKYLNCHIKGIKSLISAKLFDCNSSFFVKGLIYSYSFKYYIN